MGLDSGPSDSVWTSATPGQLERGCVGLDRPQIVLQKTILTIRVKQTQMSLIDLVIIAAMGLDEANISKMPADYG